MKWVFWVSAFVVAYVYAGFPLLLGAWARVARRRRRRRPTPAAQQGDLPPLSIVLATHNEGRRLTARLENLLSLDYPAAREIIVVSDGSTDDTAEVLERYSGRVRALFLLRSGKPASLNAGVEAARHDVLVFTDARQSFAPDALRRLAAALADPGVGAVTGELVLDTEHFVADDNASPVGEGVGLYWRYEKWIRQRESDVSSVVGATGAIYAMRRSVWRPLPPETLLDDVLAPMRVVLQGYRVVFEPGAKAFDTASPNASTEHNRKVRTLAGNYQLPWLEPRLLLPTTNPVWLQFVSHKLGRLLVPYALVALLVSTVALASAGLVYSVALVVQVTFYVLALHGATIALAPRSAAPAPASFLRESQKARSTREELVNAQVD